MKIGEHGRIMSMSIPEGWQEIGQTQDWQEFRSIRKFQPVDDAKTMLCVYYRGRRNTTISGRMFANVLRSPCHNLTADEISSLTEVLENLADSESFRMDSCFTVDLNGMTILRVEGLWIKSNQYTCEIFVCADLSGEVVQEIYFTSDEFKFDNFIEEFESSLRSIEWVREPAALHE